MLTGEMQTLREEVRVAEQPALVASQEGVAIEDGLAGRVWSPWQGFPPPRSVVSPTSVQCWDPVGAAAAQGWRPVGAPVGWSPTDGEGGPRGPLSLPPSPPPSPRVSVFG